MLAIVEGCNSVSSVDQRHGYPTLTARSGSQGKIHQFCPLRAALGDLSHRSYRCDVIRIRTECQVRSDKTGHK